MRARVAILVAGSIVLATTCALAARWDPTYEEKPQPGGKVTIPADFQPPRVQELSGFQNGNGVLTQFHVMTLDKHSLTIDGREVTRVPADTSTPMFLPGDVLIPCACRSTGFEGVLLLVDARTPFAFARAALRGLVEPARETSLVVELPNGSRGVLEVLLGRRHHAGPGQVVLVRMGSVTIDGVTIPPLPSGEVDVSTLQRVFHPKWEPRIFADDDTPFGDVVAVVTPYVHSEFTYPVIELWADEPDYFEPPVVDLSQP